MKLAKENIKSKYENIEPLGCGPHAINLIIQDVSNKPDFKGVYEEVEDVVSFFRLKRAAKAMLKKKQSESNIGKFLSYPIKTRWLSLNDSLINLLNFKEVLLTLNEQEENLLKRIKPTCKSRSVIEIVKSKPFWDKCFNLQKNIEFPVSAIKALESDSALLADAYHYLIKMIEHFKNDEDMKQRTLDRFKLINLDFMAIAYLLTPKYSSCKYLEGHKQIIIEMIINLASKHQESIASEINDELRKFVLCMKNTPNKENLSTAKIFWNDEGKQKYPNLAKFAIPFTELISSSASEMKSLNSPIVENV